MKIFLLVLAAFCFASVSHGQYNKYIIQFTDKNNSPYSLSNPSAYLTAKAIARRTKYNIAIDSTDLPVDPVYIQSVLSQGNITFLVQSKWLNDILIYTTDQAALTAISALPFVKKTQAVGNLTARKDAPVYNKFHEETDHINSPAFIQGIQGIQGDTLNYGTTYAQVHIHDGEFLHNKGYTGNGMTITFLDAGFYHYQTLSAFDSIRANNQILGVKDYVAYDTSVNEDDPHGMECLSTIAANIPGVMVGTAPKADFWLIRTENTASEYPIEEHNWVAGAEFADSAGADMITSSLGYNQFDDPAFNHTYTDFYKNTTMVSKGATYAAKKGMIVTNSAGNEGNNSWKYIIFPADADSVCTVGAVDTSGVIASFSSYGYPGRVKPNIVSVGSGTAVFSPGGVPVLGYGTSFSNPNINGLIACLWQAFPQYNNMTILDAVYKSSDRYNNPDNHYGYGIPNMRAAYLILKKMQNDSLFGNDWLFANPNPFTDTIHVTLIGQVDGPVQLTLSDNNGTVVATIHLTTEVEGVYDTTFTALNGLPGGTYTLTYKDSTTTRTITLTKNGIQLYDWLEAAPVPFANTLTVYLKAPETGNAFIRLIDASGKIIVSQQLNVTQNTTYTIPVTNAAALAKGVYFIQYEGPVQKKTVKVLKG